MDTDASQDPLIAPTSSSSSSLFEKYNDDTIIEGVAAMVKASNDDDISHMFNEIQEGRAERTSLRRLLSAPQVDDDQAMQTINMLVQYFGWNWNALNSEPDVLGAFADQSLPQLLLSYLVAKLATVRLTHLHMNCQDAHVKAIFRHAAKHILDWLCLVSRAKKNNWESFDNQVKNLVAKVVDQRIPAYFADSMRYRYMSSTTVDVVQLLEDACCSYALVSNHTPPAQSSTKFYSRYFAIVQSSGVGKTRSVLELMQHGQRVFVVYMNLRQTDNPGEPCRTPVIADLIDRHVSSDTDWQMLIVAVQMTLKGLVDANQLPSEANARLAFYTHQQDAARQNFWSDVSTNFMALRRDVGEGDAAAIKWDASRSDIFKKNTFSWINAEGQRMVLVLALDECLDSLKKDGKLLELQRAFDYTKDTLTDVVAILIDTNSSVSNFAPPDWSHGSSRVVSGSCLNTPFFYFPIDLSRQLGERFGLDITPPEKQYRTSITLTGSASSSSFSSAATSTVPSAVVVRYNPVEEVLCSRPLFATYFCNEIDNAVTRGSCSDVFIEDRFKACMDMVASKLAARPADPQSERIRLFSYAAIRWQAMTYSRVMIESLVGQQLGLIREVGPHMETIWCAYGLEPLLGRHVASEMTASASVFENTLRTLHDLQAQGQLYGYEGRGDHGELVATIVLSRAHDQAFARMSTATPSTTQKYGPVLLRDWLAQLLDDDVSLWGELQNQGGNALDRAVVYFHSVHRVESDSTPLITVEMVRWYLQRGTAMVSPRGLVATDLFIPFAVPKDGVIDLMDPDTYVLGVMPVQVKNVITDVDNEALLRSMLFSDILKQFPSDAPRVGLVMHMNPDVGQGASSVSTTESKDFFSLADIRKSPRFSPETPTATTFMPCGFVKYFRNRIPCIQQGADNGEAAMRLLRSMMKFVPFARLTTMTLQQYHRTAGGYARTEEQLQPTVRSLGEVMFHINRQYDDDKKDSAKFAGVATKARQPTNPPDTKEGNDDNTTVPMEDLQSRKRSAPEPQHDAKRTKDEGTSTRPSETTRSEGVNY